MPGKLVCEDCHQKRYVNYGLPSEGRKWRWCAKCAGKHAGARNVRNKQCETCLKMAATHGLIKGGKKWCTGCSKAQPGAVSKTGKCCDDCGQGPNEAVSVVFGQHEDGKRKWCRPCASKHGGAFIPQNPCEVCGKTANFGMPAERRMRWCGGCSKHHPGAENIGQKKCEDCHKKHPTFGMELDKKRRWCKLCATKGHPGSIAIVSGRVCTDCASKKPTYGIPGTDAKAVWCATCARSHPGAKDMVSQLCQGCHNVAPSYGYANAPDKRLWCSGCAKAHEGAVSLSKHKCEGCQLKVASFGLPEEGLRRRWCKTCAVAHGRGAVLATGGKSTCEDCTIKKPYWGDGTNRRARWCGSCATNHENATELHKRSCEDCVVKAPSYGMPDPAKPGVLPRRRWCAACRVNHPGSIQSNGSKCQECATKSAKIGLPNEQRPRWCSEKCLLECVYKNREGGAAGSQISTLKATIAGLKRENNQLKKARDKMGAKLDAVNCPACRGKRKPHTCGMSDSVVVLPGDVAAAAEDPSGRLPGYGVAAEQPKKRQKLKPAAKDGRASVSGKRKDGTPDGRTKAGQISKLAAGMGGTAAAAEEPVVTGAAAPAVTVLEPAKLPGGEATV